MARKETLIPVGRIDALIFFIRGLKVMLSPHLAELERKFGTHDEQIQAIFEAIRQLMAPPAPEPPEPPRKEMGFHIKEDDVPYRIKRPSRTSRTERRTWPNRFS